MAWRFPSEFSQFQHLSEFPKKLKKEAELSESSLKKEFEYVGLRGYSGSVRLDGILNNPNTKQIKHKDTIKVVRK